MRIFYFGVALLLACDASRVRADDPLDATTLEKIGQGELVFTAKITKITRGPTALSDPPILSYTFDFNDVKSLRGTVPEKPKAHWNIRTKNEPMLKIGDELLLVAHFLENGIRIDSLLTANEKVVALAKEAAALPIGWKIEAGKIVSPWATLGKKLWPKKQPIVMGPVCPKSGRPALLCGNGIEISSEQIKPAKVHEFKNPFGDGQFKITVTNKSKETAKVHALLTDGKTIFWEDSLIIISNGKSFVHPGAGKGTGFNPVELKAGESVSGTIDTLPIKGIEWPRGGSRVYLQFCLGDKATSNFFYYLSNHHDALRDGALKKINP